MNIDTIIECQDFIEMKVYPKPIYSNCQTKFIWLSCKMYYYICSTWKAKFKSVIKYDITLVTTEITTNQMTTWCVLRRPIRLIGQTMPTWRNRFITTLTVVQRTLVLLFVIKWVYIWMKLFARVFQFIVNIF